MFRFEQPSRDLVAVVIEDNPPPTLVPVTLHFAAVLGPAWKVIVYTLEENWVVPDSAPFRRAMESNTIEIRFLPPGTVLTDGTLYSKFLGSTWLWEQLQDAARVLMFQTDSILCSNSDKRAEDFTEYDFIGAPLAPAYGRGYNGGLSIRNPKLFLNITREAKLDNIEDQWFFAQAEARVKDGVKLPSVDVAKTFSVETTLYDKPLGYHQPDRYLSPYIDSMLQWCPEIALIGKKRTPQDTGPF